MRQPVQFRSEKRNRQGQVERFCEGFPLAVTLGPCPTKLMEGHMLGNVDFPPTSNIYPQVDRQGQNTFDTGSRYLQLLSHVFLATFSMVLQKLAKYQGKVLKCVISP